MKKKFLLLFPILIGAASLTSCQNKTTHFEIKRIEGQSTYVSLTYEELAQKFAHEDSFVIYINQSGCLSCAAFEPILTSYITSNGAVIYGITSQELSKGNLISIKYTPTVALVNSGKVISKVDSSSKNKELETSSNFQKYLQKYTYLSSRIRIDEDTLDAKIAGKETFIVEYTWDSCGDCQTLEKLYLNEFRKNHPEWTFYELELSYYYDHRENKDDPLWTEMTKKYQLSKEGSEKFGYNNGVVPTFQFYSLGVLSDAAVIYNDNIESTISATGDVTAVKVIDSYFKDAPFVGKTFVPKNGDSAYTRYKIQTLSFYQGKIESIFNKIYF